MSAEWDQPPRGWKTDHTARLVPGEAAHGGFFDFWGVPLEANAKSQLSLVRILAFYSSPHQKPEGFCCCDPSTPGERNARNDVPSRSILSPSSQCMWRRMQFPAAQYIVVTPTSNRCEMTQGNSAPTKQKERPLAWGTVLLPKRSEAVKKSQKSQNATLRMPIN